MKNNQVKALQIFIIILCVILFVIIVLPKGKLPKKAEKPQEEVASQPLEAATSEQHEPRLLKAGDCFEIGDYIQFDNITITYLGCESHDYHFLFENNNENDVMISPSIVGVKKSGEYELLGLPACFGNDEERYNKDKKENGWAVMHTTNIVPKNGAREMTAQIYDIWESEEYPGFDPDKDGFYDVMFTAYHQTEEGHTITYTGAPESELYRIKVN